MKLYRNFYASSYNCDFTVYMKDKARKYGILYCILAGAKDRYALRVIFHVAHQLIILKKKENSYDQVIEIPKNIFNTGRNMAGDRSYSSIDIKELYQKKKATYVGAIIPCR